MNFFEDATDVHIIRILCKTTENSQKTLIFLTLVFTFYFATNRIEKEHEIILTILLLKCRY